MPEIRKRGRPPIGTRVPVRFPAATLARIEQLAADADVSRAEMIRRLVDETLERKK